jgi:hypothetical protein
MSGFSWSGDPRQFVDNVIDDVDREISYIATQIFRELVTESPVYSGALRACWRVSQSKPNVVSMPGRHAEGSIKFPSLRALRFKGLKEIHITNGQYYAVYIEYGSSRNSPQAFVQKAVDRATR